MRSLEAEEIRPGLRVCVVVRPSRQAKRPRTVRGVVEEVYPRFFTVHDGRRREGFLLADVARGSVEVVEL